MRCPSPPSCSRSRVPVACSTEPADRKSSPLKRLWFSTWSKRSGEAEGLHHRVPQALAEGAEPQAQQDDPDVLDGVVGEQALQVVLAQGEGHAEDARQGAQRHQRSAPPDGRIRDPGQEPHQPEDAHLEQHARHQRRNMTGGGGMGRRQPEVQRKDARLEPEAQQEQPEEDRSLAAGGQARRAAPQSPHAHGPWPAARRPRTGTACRCGWPPGRSSRPAGSRPRDPRPAPARRRRWPCPPRPAGRSGRGTPAPTSAARPSGARRPGAGPGCCPGGPPSSPDCRSPHTRTAAGLGSQRRRPPDQAPGTPGSPARPCAG